MSVLCGLMGALMTWQPENHQAVTADNTHDGCGSSMLTRAEAFSNRLANALTLTACHFH